MAPFIPKTTTHNTSAISPRKTTPNAITSRKSTHKSSTSQGTRQYTKPSKSFKPQKPIFKNLTLSIAGTIYDTAGKTISHESIMKWWTLHGGEFEREVTAETTHLICSIEEFKRRGPQVKKAWSFRTKDHQCYVVIFDWLEDCLLGPKGQKRRLVEKSYTLDRTIKRLEKGKTDHADFRNNFEDGLYTEGLYKRVSKELCDNRLNKIYLDNDGFEYKVTLSRSDYSTGRVITERYTLYLFESIAKPHTYMTGAKLSRMHRPISYYREWCKPKPFPEAFHDFRHFFYDKTQIQWEDRLEGFRRPNAFIYVPPVLGRPVGWVPLGKGLKRLDWREEKREMTDDEKALSREQVVYDTDSDVDETEDVPMPFITGFPTIAVTPSPPPFGQVCGTGNSRILPGPVLAQPVPALPNEYGYQPYIAEIGVQPISEVSTTPEGNTTLTSVANHAH